MKKILSVVSITILMIILLCTNLTTFAMHTGFTTSKINDEELELIMANTDITLISTEPSKQPINCINISEYGYIALGFSNNESKIICVYDDNFNFEYGYQFTDYGDFGIDWSGSNIVICLVRSNLAIEIDSSGNIIEILKINNNLENNTHWNRLIYSEECIFENKTYTLKNDMAFLNYFKSNYSQLVVFDENGEQVLYNVNSTEFAKTIIIFTCVILLVCLTVLLLITQGNKDRTKDKTGDGSLS